MENKSVIFLPSSFGELIDKITVLSIKKERILEKDRLENINRELSMLEEVKIKTLYGDKELSSRLEKLELALKKSNEEIWDMGDKIRECGEKKDFGKSFVEVALGIHLANDRRAFIKKEINLLVGSSIIEEKSYKHWK